MAWDRWAGITALCATVTLGACDRPDAASSNAGTASSVHPTASAAAAPTRAVITMDTAHDMMNVKDAAEYTIAPSAEVVIEIGEHRFTTRDGGPATPDAVHVVHGSSGYHRATFSGKRVTLNTASLDPVKGGAFPGFEAGESYIVAVGAEAPAASDGAMRFTPLWTAKVNVAPR